MALESSPEHPQPLGRVIQAARGWIDRLGAVWVEAQVIELKRRSSPTQFLVLRDKHADASATVTCSRQVLDQAGPITEGTTVAAWVKPTLWPNSAQFSFECRELRVVGEGRLLAALEQLKRKLQAEGLFDPSRKQRLPVMPGLIGLVTGRDSAAERDVVTTISSRWPAAQIRTQHVLVQGPEAAEQVIGALATLDRDPAVQVIIIARGGGSLEDLLPFSDEGLVRAVAAARTPVVSAIGHEPDSPILDLVADLRALTPTDAGKRVVPDVREEAERVQQTLSRLRAAIDHRLRRAEQELAGLVSRPVLRNPLASFEAHLDRLENLQLRLDRSVDGLLAREEQTISHALARVRSMSPKATLERGYAILVDGGGDSVTSVAEVDDGDDLLAYLADGTLTLEVRDTSPRPSLEGSAP